MSQNLLILAVPVLAAFAAPAAAAGLDALRWKARPVIVFASADDARAADQIARLQRDRAALEEREMSVFLVGRAGVTTLAGGRAPSGLDAAALRREYRVTDDAFAVVLVGKDGGEKLRFTEPVDAAKLTQTVDRMPMRRNEAR